MKLKKADQEDVEAPWAVAGKEAAQGFGSLHLRRPSVGPTPDVFYYWFMVEQVQLDAQGWAYKRRPCDDGTACGVNGAVRMLSHVDYNTLDRYAATAQRSCVGLRRLGIPGALGR